MATPPGRSKAPVRAVAIVAGFAALLYLPTLAFSLVWDDPLLRNVVRSRLQDGGLPALLTSEFVTASAHTGYFRPVVLLSLAVDGWLGGGNPWMFHLTNIALHAFVCGLVLLLLQRILRDDAAAMFGALVFAAHPAHVEAVAFVSGRTDLWAAVFVLGACLFWIRGREVNGDGRLRATSIAASVSLSLGALSKELAVMAIPTWLAWDLLGCAGTGPRPTPWVRRNASWLVASIVGLAVVAMLRWGALGTIVGGAPPPVLAVGAREPSALALLVPRLATYMRLLVCPWPLSAYYGSSDLTVGWGTALGAILASGMFVLAGATRRPRFGAAGLVWTLLFLVPVLGITSLSTAAAAERFVYIPSLGACLALAALWGRLHERKRVAALAAGAALLALCSTVTLIRSRVWQDQLALYTDMARTSPREFVAHYNLGTELAAKGLLSDAETELVRAGELAPARAEVWNNLGTVRLRLGKDADAATAYAEAVRAKPDFVVALRNLNDVLTRLGRSADALQVYADAISALDKLETLRADEVEYLVDAGKAVGYAQRWSDAERAFRRALRAAPDHSKAYGYLGGVYLYQGNAADAIPLLERAIAMDPGDESARITLEQARRAKSRSSR